MRFLADMGISPRIVDVLERLGYAKALEDGAIITVTEGRVRVRNLPLETSE
jgi:hypothetical protein